MLYSLTIRDFVLVTHLHLDMQGGLTAFTGETGAGKSILLDALALICGARADSGCVRVGAEQSDLTAVFTIPAKHPVLNALQDLGLHCDLQDGLILRRIISADGRSRAFVNDQPSSIGALKTLGSLLVDIHGQFDTLGLLADDTARDILDHYGALQSDVTLVKQHFAALFAAKKELAQAISDQVKAQADQDWLNHAVNELEECDPQPLEENELLEQKRQIQNFAQTQETYNEAMGYLESDTGSIYTLHRAARLLERLGDKAENTIKETLLPALHNALDAAHIARDGLENLLSHMPNLASLETIDDRLHLLRDLARKHKTTIAELPALTTQLQQRQQALKLGDTRINQLQALVESAQNTYTTAANELSAKRSKIAKKMEQAVAKELPPLLLKNAQFFVSITSCTASEFGTDLITFTAITNPGQQADSLPKIASGGELSRFMLALKLVLAKSSPVVCLVFDEIDSGMGGATASSIGARLRGLGQDKQTLIVTHAPQVAAFANLHYIVSKNSKNGTTTSQVSLLDTATKRAEELARMLAGKTITDEARMAAAQLLSEAA